MGNNMQLSVCPHPLRAHVENTVAEFGGTVADVLHKGGYGYVLDPKTNAVISIERPDEVIDLTHEDCLTFTPIPGDTIGVRVLPSGGGGGGKSPLRMVLMIAVIVVAAYAGAVLGPILAKAMGVASASGIVGAGVTSAVGMVGSMIVNAIAPPPMPKAPSLGGAGNEATNPTYSLTGSSNKANKYGPVAQMMGGQYRVYPPHAAEPYTEIAGDDTFLRQRFAMYGPMKISDMRIGDTPIDQFEDVEIEACEGWSTDTVPTLYADSKDIHQESLSIDLRQESGWIQRRTNPDADEIIFDITFPSGLYEIGQSNGKRESTTVQFKAQFAAFDSAAEYSDTDDPNYVAPEDRGWQDFPDASGGTISISGKHLSRSARSFRATVERGQYDVRWQRSTVDDETGYIVDTTALTAIRTITARPGIDRDNLPPMAQIDIRIRANGQLNGTINEFSFLGEAYLPVWDSETEQFDMQLSDNPAWAYVNVLRGAANKRAVPDDRLDMVKINEWAQFCEENDLRINAILDYSSTVWQVLHDVASVGRASRSMRDNLYSICVDNEKSVAVQTFTPRNSWGFEGSKSFPDKPHALRCRFVNAEEDYQQDERYVYADGYDETNAELFEDIDFWGVTDADQVWRQGRFHYADAKLRPEIFNINVDIENLRCTRGDRIKLVHDVILVGLGAARIRNSATRFADGVEVSYNPIQKDEQGRVIGVEIDSEWVFEDDKTYSCGIQLMDGDNVTATLSSMVGDHKVLTFVEPIPATAAPEGGELIWYGESGKEAEDCIITKIDANSDFTAKLTLRHYAPEVFLADQGEIPDFESNISHTPETKRKPGKTVVHSVQSDETVLLRQPDGTLQTRILMSVSSSPGDLDTEYYQVHYRSVDGDWLTIPDVPADSGTVAVTGVEDGETYDIRIRSVSRSGKVSAWTLINAHTVIGKTTPPPNVSTLFMINGRLVWTYPDAPLDLAGFKLRYNFGQDPAWERGSEVHGGLVTANELDVSGFNGPMTFMVKAQDTSGLESGRASTLYKDMGDPIETNVVERFEMHPDFEGTVAGGMLVDDAIKAEGSPLWSGNDANLLWTGVDHNSFWSDTFADLSYEFRINPDISMFGADMFLESEVQGDGFKILYATDSQRLLWTTQPAKELWTAVADSQWWDGRTDWVDWTGVLHTIQPQSHFFKMSLAGGSNQGIISKVSCVVDAPDIVESINDVVLDQSGVRLPLLQSYRKIKNVSLTIQDDGGNADLAKVYDKDAVLGPLVKAKDVDGNFVSATIDAVVQGY